MSQQSVTLKSTLVTKQYDLNYRSVVGMTCYKGTIYWLVYSRHDGFFLLSDRPDLTKIGDPLPNDTIGDPSAKPIVMQTSPTGRYIYSLFLRNTSDGFTVWEIEVDVDQKKITKLDKRYVWKPDWYSGDPADMAFSYFLDMYTLLACSGDSETQSAYLHNFITGDTVKLGTPESGYCPYLTQKLFIRTDDVYVLAGVHLAGRSPFWLKLYQRKWESTGTGGASYGGSPRVSIGNMIVDKDVGKILLGGTGGVVDTENVLFFFDEKGVMWYINPKDLTGAPETTLDLMPGSTILGVTDDGYLLMLIHVRGSDYNKDNRHVVCWVAFVDPINRKLGDSFPVMIDKAHYFECPNHQCCTISQAPIIDMDSRKIKYFWKMVNPQEDRSCPHYVEYVEIDLNDYWYHVKRWNPLVPIKKAGMMKIPTVLTLQVEVL